MMPYFEISEYEFYVVQWEEPLNWPPHLHPEIELIYVRKGALETTVDSQTRVMREGDFAVAFPNSVHSYRVVPGFEHHTDIRLYLFNWHMAGDYADKMNTFVPRTPFVDTSCMREDTYIALERLMLQREDYHPSMAKSYLQIVLAGIWKHFLPLQYRWRSCRLPLP